MNYVTLLWSAALILLALTGAIGGVFAYFKPRYAGQPAEPYQKTLIYGGMLVMATALLGFLALIAQGYFESVPLALLITMMIAMAASLGHFLAMAQAKTEPRAKIPSPLAHS